MGKGEWGRGKGEWGMGNGEGGMGNGEWGVGSGISSPLPTPHSPFPTQPRLFSVKNDIASIRVRSSLLKTPRTAEVIVVAPAFLTPRIVMQRWSASITTITPFGCRSP